MTSTGLLQGLTHRYLLAQHEVQAEPAAGTSGAVAHMGKPGVQGRAKVQTWLKRAPSQIGSAVPALVRVALALLPFTSFPEPGHFFSLFLAR